MERDRERVALPPGDCTSWGVLTAATVLEGVAWPGFGVLGWDCPLLEGAR